MKYENLEKIAETITNMVAAHTREPVDYTKLVTKDHFGNIVYEIENAYKHGVNHVMFTDFQLEVSMLIGKCLKGFVIMASDDRAQYHKTSIVLFNQNNKVMWKYLDRMARLKTGVTSLIYEVPGERELRELLASLMKLISNAKRKLKLIQIEDMWNLYEFENHINEPNEGIPVGGYLSEFDKAEYELIERQLKNIRNEYGFDAFTHVLSKFNNK